MAEPNVSAIAQSDSDVELLGTSPRRGFHVVNDSESFMYLRLGSTPASPADYSIPLVAGAVFEEPTSYDGPVHAVWVEAGSGVARVTEVPV